ncbi:hypothetical protein [Kosakonia arachidis]|nr:hypothetical protein [Kosakonia arachidis]
MMSRLFGDADTELAVQTTLTKNNISMSSYNFLTSGDRDMLSNLYATAQEQGIDLRYVDGLARDLGDYRMFSPVEGNSNTGIYDMAGRRLTFSFTDTDMATASRIQDSNKLSGSVLPSGFLDYELDPGFAFNHTASFDFLALVVNNPAMHGDAASRFSTYQSQGKNNYVIKTADEVTLDTTEPDFSSVDGVFSVTETGKKHGFSLVNGQPTQNMTSSTDKSHIPTEQSMTQSLLDAVWPKSKFTSEPSSLFDFLYSSGLTEKAQD